MRERACLGLLLVGAVACLQVHEAEAQRAPKKKPVLAAPVSEVPAEPEPPPTEAIAPTVTRLKAGAAPQSPAPAGPRTTLYVYEERLPDTTLDQALASFAAALVAEPRIQFLDLGEILEPPERADEELTKADEEATAAGRAFEEMNLEDARSGLESAIRRYEKNLPRLALRPGGTQRLRDAWVRLAGARFVDGNADGAREALRHVFVLDPKLAYSPKLFPPQMKKLVAEARLLFETLGTGKLTVESEPAGATLFVDGVPQGTTPMTVEEVAAGPHLVTLQRRGYAPAIATVEVNGGGDEARAQQAMLRFDDDPIGRFERVRPDLGTRVVPTALGEAGRRLGVELIVLVAVRPPVAEGATAKKARKPAPLVSAWLYDLRPGRLLRHVEVDGKDDQIDDTVRRAAAQLFEGLRLDGKEEPGLFARLGEGFSRVGDNLVAFRRWRWFWPVVGGAAAVLVGAAVGIGVAASDRPGLTPAEQTVILLGIGGR